MVRSCAKKQPRGVFTVSGDLSNYDDGRRDLRLSMQEHFRESLKIYNGVVFDNGRANRAIRGDALELDAAADLVYMDPPYVPRADEIFYAFMVPIFGGRTWTTLTTASLLIPAVGIGFAVRNPHTSYATMLTLALLCGLGGGNFASSMSNISFFFPKSQKGTALGLNAGLGNLGVSVMQFLVPLVISTGMFGALCGDPQSCVIKGATRPVWMQNAGFVWVPFILAATIAAWFGMNDLANVRASFREQAVIFRRKHNWIMCWLYLGTFGSFIGYSAGLPLLIKSEFPALDPVKYAFLGPLVGAAIRPVGGWLADRLGGARVTFWNFFVMAAAALGALHYMPHGGSAGNFAGFLTMFILIFVATGIGNGSTFRMIPIIFLTEHQQAAAGKGEEAQRQAQAAAGKEAAAVLGFSSAFAAYGAFFIPKSFGTSLVLTGTPAAALYGFVAFYLSCIVLTWWFYSRKNAPMPC
ncbi:MFS transporter [Geomonas sp. Red276]